MLLCTFRVRFNARESERFAFQISFLVQRSSLCSRVSFVNFLCRVDVSFTAGWIVLLVGFC
jgi:hypothetical protein